MIEQMQSKRRQAAGSVSKQPQSPVSKYYPHRRSKTIKHWKGRNAIQELRTDDEEKSIRLGATGRGQYAKMFLQFLIHSTKRIRAFFLDPGPKKISYKFLRSHDKQKGKLFSPQTVI